MLFPARIDSKKNNSLKRAQLRLRHMLATATLNKYGSASMRRMCRNNGFDHATVSIYIKRGQFSLKMALKIEALFGRDVLPHEALIDPLSV